VKPQAHDVEGVAPPAWMPSAALQRLVLRARMLAKIRAFFQARQVMEVETPILSSATVTDPNIESITAESPLSATAPLAPLFLQTSPEFHMKRLLAAGSGPIYQICKSFRKGESGRLHNPEFTMLEWYRPGFDHHALMDEVDALMGELLQLEAAERITCGEAYRRYADIDPYRDPPSVLQDCARASGILPVIGLAVDDRDAWLDLLLSHVVGPRLGRDRPVFIYDFPRSQASLAQVRRGPPDVAERFELFINGVEIANGAHELRDDREQRRRFEAEGARRRVRGLADVPVDERLLGALAHGLPDCAGVAVGLDRVMMVAAAALEIAEVLSFSLERA